MLHPDYPFAPRRVEIRPGIALSYLDEGPRDGEVVVMLHGNPSWSYYWRRLVLGLRDRYRCIVPDHVGMGLSDKPDDGGGVRQPDTPRADGDATARYDYTLASRIDDLQALLRHAGIDDATPVTLVVHDWGGMVGFGWALAHAAQVRRLVILNTAAFPLPTAKAMPWQLSMGRDSRIGGWLIRRFNLFARGAALPQEKQPARRRPEQRAGDRCDEDRPAREVVARGDAHQERDALRREQQRADVQCLQRRAEPEHAAREPDAEEGEDRVRERVLAEQHAVARVGQETQRPAHAEADHARLADAPEQQHQRDEVGHHAQVAPRQEVEQQRDRERHDDRAEPHRLEDLAATGKIHPCPDLSAGRAACLSKYPSPPGAAA